MSIDLRPGAELAGYRVESVIGRGGMGEVYLAEHIRLKRKAALKVLPPELARDALFRDRFIHESELAASLDHPHIVDIYDAGEANGLLYLAMRYVGGLDLKSLIKRDGPLDPERAVALLTQVAGALDVAHERGLVHRDVKPANVLIEPPTSSLGEHAYLSDFGLTKRPESMSGLTRTGQFLGSVEYAAPEQFEGKPLGPWTDVYALGGVAYECLTGQVPFPRDTEAAVMHAHLHDSPPKVTAKRAELPAGLDAAVSTAMAKRPEDRYPSAGALTEALGAGARGEAVVTAGARRRRRVIALAAGIVALAAIAGAAFALTRPDAPPKRPAGPAQVTLGVVRIDPATNRLTDVIPVAGVTDIATGDGFVWAAAGSTLAKISETSRTLVGHVDIPHSPFRLGTGVHAVEIAVGNGRVWDIAPTDPLLVTSPSTVREVDPSRNEVVRTLQVSNPTSAAFGAGALWISSVAAAEVYKVDPETGRVLQTIPVESIQESPNAIAAGAEGVWVVQTAQGLATHIDPETGDIVGTAPIPQADGVAVGGGSAWVIAEREGTVTRVNPATDAILNTITVGSPSTGRCGVPGGLAVTSTDVWVLSSEDGMLVRIDRQSEEIVTRIRIGACPYAVAVDSAGVWVSRTLDVPF
jgi:tRNA A-37 threonylcarbamoyl transferase component Bud32/outer membrane protein assembly factor BamB